MDREFYCHKCDKTVFIDPVFLDSSYASMKVYLVPTHLASKTEYVNYVAKELNLSDKDRDKLHKKTKIISIDLVHTTSIEDPNGDHYIGTHSCYTNEDFYLN